MSGVRPGGEIALHVEFFSNFWGGSGIFYHIRSIEYQYKMHHLGAYGAHKAK